MAGGAVTRGVGDTRGFYGRAVGEVMRSALPQTQKWALVALLTTADDNGISTASVPRIATLACLKDRAVQYALKALEAHDATSATPAVPGWLKRETRSGRSAVWRYLGPPAATGACGAPVQVVHLRTECTGADDAPAQPMHPGGAPDAPPPRTECTAATLDARAGPTSDLSLSRESDRARGEGRTECTGAGDAPVPADIGPPPRPLPPPSKTVGDLETLALACMPAGARRGGMMLDGVSGNLLYMLAQKHGVDECDRVLRERCGGAERPVAMLKAILEPDERRGRGAPRGRAPFVNPTAGIAESWDGARAPDLPVIDEDGEE